MENPSPLILRLSGCHRGTEVIVGTGDELLLNYNLMSGTLLARRIFFPVEIIHEFS